jgi:uncharacterized protein (TIGR02646 family)
MKKIIKSAEAPGLLAAYLEANPEDDWDQFRGNAPDGYQAVKASLNRDQLGLCAYCEIDLVSGNGQALDDFRVEHFFPKKPHTPPPNRSLDWNNLLAVCTGGNFRSLAAKGRFTSPDCSCDVPKENKDWTGSILNPLIDVPAFPRLFCYVEQSGSMAVDEALCPPELKSKAEATIQLLHLSPIPTAKIPCSRLERFRIAIFDMLREEIGELLQAGLDEPTAAARLAEVHFSDNKDKPWPAFFTCIRWYLGTAAETRLREIGFNG